MRKRDYKLFEKGGIYHIFNRGVGKMNIFEKEKDFKVFLYRIKENLYPEEHTNSFVYKRKEYKRKLLPPDSFDLICYCLMPNHFHLMLQQKTELSISKLVSKFSTGYSMYFNRDRDRVGSLFQDAFKAVSIENNEQMLWTSLYIHENPQKLGLVKKPENYKWSSFLDYLNPSRNSICKREILFGQFNSPDSYLKYFKNPKENKEAQREMLAFQDLFIDEDFLENCT
ncbi:MAG: transposase [Candidatus Zambryskibacteria bacterium]|nr:transposase [Candidatus Zambryskibacteria bacterium]